MAANKRNEAGQYESAVKSDRPGLLETMFLSKANTEKKPKPPIKLNQEQAVSYGIQTHVVSRSMNTEKKEVRTTYEKKETKSSKFQRHEISIDSMKEQKVVKKSSFKRKLYKRPEKSKMEAGDLDFDSDDLDLDKEPIRRKVTKGKAPVIKMDEFDELDLDSQKALAVKYTSTPDKPGEKLSLKSSFKSLRTSMRTFGKKKSRQEAQRTLEGLDVDTPKLEVDLDREDLFGDAQDFEENYGKLYDATTPVKWEGRTKEEEEDTYIKDLGDRDSDLDDLVLEGLEGDVENSSSSEEDILWDPVVVKSQKDLKQEKEYAQPQSTVQRFNPPRDLLKPKSSTDFTSGSAGMKHQQYKYSQTTYKANIDKHKGDKSNPRSLPAERPIGKVSSFGKVHGKANRDSDVTAICRDKLGPINTNNMQTIVKQPIRVEVESDDETGRSNPLKIKDMDKPNPFKSMDPDKTNPFKSEDNYKPNPLKIEDKDKPNRFKLQHTDKPNPFKSEDMDKPNPFKRQYQTKEIKTEDIAKKRTGRKDIDMDKYMEEFQQIVQKGEMVIEDVVKTEVVPRNDPLTPFFGVNIQYIDEGSTEESLDEEKPKEEMKETQGAKPGENKDKEVDEEENEEMNENPEEDALDLSFDIHNIPEPIIVTEPTDSSANDVFPKPEARSVYSITQSNQKEAQSNQRAGLSTDHETSTNEVSCKVAEKENIWTMAMERQENITFDPTELDNEQATVKTNRVAENKNIWTKSRPEKNEKAEKNENIFDTEVKQGYYKYVDTAKEDKDDLGEEVQHEEIIKEGINETEVVKEGTNDTKVVKEGVSDAETVKEGVNDVETVKEGVSDAETVKEGVNYVETVKEGVSDAEIVREGVNDAETVKECAGVAETVKEGVNDVETVKVCVNDVETVRGVSDSETVKEGVNHQNTVDEVLDDKETAIKIVSDDIVRNVVSNAVAVIDSDNEVDVKKKTVKEGVNDEKTVNQSIDYEETAIKVVSEEFVKKVLNEAVNVIKNDVDVREGTVKIPANCIANDEETVKEGISDEETVMEGVSDVETVKEGVTEPVIDKETAFKTVSEDIARKVISDAVAVMKSVNDADVNTKKTVKEGVINAETVKEGVSDTDTVEEVVEKAVKEVVGAEETVMDSVKHVRTVSVNETETVKEAVRDVETVIRVVDITDKVNKLLNDPKLVHSDNSDQTKIVNNIYKGIPGECQLKASQGADFKQKYEGRRECGMTSGKFEDSLKTNDERVALSGCVTLSDVYDRREIATQSVTVSKGEQHPTGDVTARLTREAEKSQRVKEETVILEDERVKQYRNEEITEKRQCEQRIKETPSEHRVKRETVELERGNITREVGSSEGKRWEVELLIGETIKKEADTEEAADETQSDERVKQTETSPLESESGTLKLKLSETPIKPDQNEQLNDDPLLMKILSQSIDKQMIDKPHRKEHTNEMKSDREVTTESTVPDPKIGKECPQRNRKQENEPGKEAPKVKTEFSEQRTASAEKHSELSDVYAKIVKTLTKVQSGELKVPTKTRPGEEELNAQNEEMRKVEERVHEEDKNEDNEYSVKVGIPFIYLCMLCCLVYSFMFIANTYNLSVVFSVSRLLPALRHPRKYICNLLTLFLSYISNYCQCLYILMHYHFLFINDQNVGNFGTLHYNAKSINYERYQLLQDMLLKEVHVGQNCFGIDMMLKSKVPFFCHGPRPYVPYLTRILSHPT